MNIQMLLTVSAQKNKMQNTVCTRSNHIRGLPFNRSVRMRTLACFLARVADRMAADDATRMAA